MFSLWMLGVKTSNLNIILSLAGVSAKPQGVPLVTILIFTVGSSLCLKLMILSSFQDLLVQPPRSDFRRKKVAELNFNLSWKLNIGTPERKELLLFPWERCWWGRARPDWWWVMLGMSTPRERETTSRPCLPWIHNTQGKWEECVISVGSAGSASSDNNIAQTTNTDAEYNWQVIDMMTRCCSKLTTQLYTEL